MSTSPVDPQDIRAAAEVQRELGPEYSDAVIAAFIDRVDRAVEARVEARLAEERRHLPVTPSGRRRTLLKGVALGVGAGALVAGASISHIEAAHGSQGASVSVFAKPDPGHRQFKIFRDRGGKPQIRVIKPGALPPAPKR
jgi:hypothetical protein